MHFDDSISNQPLRDVYSISRLNREARSLLEGSFPLLWIEGEVSNFARPASGHWYFSLKDEAAQVRCAMFRNKNRHIGFVPENGTQVLIRARIGLYEARGEFQIIAEHMEEAGDGALRRAFEILKQKLQNEGLFSQEQKKPVPAWPKQIGVITSPTGAAIKDILSTLRRRFPDLAIVVYPVTVQGTDSADQIAKMIATAALRNECDVLILARGGGSLEDLWSFNEEKLARAIYACPIPIVAGIGHEIDFTIADFVADQRAPTPTAAAELVSPNRPDIQMQFEQYEKRLLSLLQARIEQATQKLQWLGKRIQHPGRRLQDRAQRLDDLQGRQLTAINNTLRHSSLAITHLHGRLHLLNPVLQISQQKKQLAYVYRQITNGMKLILDNKHQSTARLAHSLNTVSPLATLERGYAIVSRQADNQLIRSYKQVNPGEPIKARLADGELLCRVENVATSTK